MESEYGELEVSPMGPEFTNDLNMTQSNDTLDLSMYNMNPELQEMWRCLHAANGSQNNSCGMDGFDMNMDMDSSEFNVLKDPAFAMIVIVCYIIVIFLGAVGNFMVVLTVIKTKQMWNATNLFIANLALADIFVCIFDLPFSVYSQLTGTWLFGSALCKLIPMLFGMVVYSSTLTLTMIAIDRYILVVHPLMTRMSLKLAMVLIVVIALVSASVASPIAVYSRYEVYHDPGIKVYKQWCYEKWPSLRHRQIYTILTLVLQYFIPIVIVGVLYLLIFISINRRMRKVGKNKNCRKTKTTKMLVAVVTVFAVTWTPFHIHSILSEFRINPFGEYYLFADAMLRVVAMSSSCINPLLYGWLNDNYKKAFLSIIRKPTMAPKGIQREESDHTVHHINRTPSPTKGMKRPLLLNSSIEQRTTTSSIDNYNPPSSPEKVALSKVVKHNGVGNGDVYHSVAQADNNGSSVQVILEKP